MFILTRKLIVIIVIVNHLYICSADNFLSPKSKLIKKNSDLILLDTITLPNKNYNLSKAGIILPTQQKTQNTFNRDLLFPAKDEQKSDFKIIQPSENDIKKISKVFDKNPFSQIFIPKNVNFMLNEEINNDSDDVVKEQSDIYEFFIQKKLFTYIEKNRLNFLNKKEKRNHNERNFSLNEQVFLKNLFLLNGEKAAFYLVDYCKNKDGFFIAWTLLSASFLKRNDFEDYIPYLDTHLYQKLEKSERIKIREELKLTLNWISLLYTKEGHFYLNEYNILLPFLAALQCIIKGIGGIDSDILLENFINKVSHMENIYNALEPLEKHLVFQNLKSKTILEYEKILSILIYESSLSDIGSKKNYSLSLILKLLHKEMDKAYDIFNNYFSGKEIINTNDLIFYWELYMAKIQKMLKEKDRIEGIPETDTIGLEYEFNISTEYRTHGGTENTLKGMNNLKSFLLNIPYILDGSLHIHGGRNKKEMSVNEYLALKKAVICYQNYWLGTLYLPLKTASKIDLGILTIPEINDFFTDNFEFEHSDIIHPEEENGIITLEFKNLTPPETIYTFSGRNFSYLQDLITIVLSLHYEITLNPLRFNILNMGNPLINGESPSPIDKIHLLKFLKFTFKNTPNAIESFMRVFEICNPSYTTPGNVDRINYSKERIDEMIKSLYADKGLIIIYELNKASNNFFDKNALERVKKVSTKNKLTEKHMRAEILSFYLYILKYGTDTEKVTALSELKTIIDSETLKLFTQSEKIFFQSLEKYTERKTDAIENILYLMQFLDADFLEDIFSSQKLHNKQTKNILNLFMNSLMNFIKSYDCHKHNIIKLCKNIINVTANKLDKKDQLQLFDFEFELCKKNIIPNNFIFDYLYHVISPHILKLDSKTANNLLKIVFSKINENRIKSENLYFLFRDIIMPIINQLDKNDTNLSLKKALSLLQNEKIPNNKIIFFFQYVLLPMCDKAQKYNNIILDNALLMLNNKKIPSNQIIHFFNDIIKPLTLKMDENASKKAFNIALQQPLDILNDYFLETCIISFTSKMNKSYLPEAVDNLLILTNNTKKENPSTLKIAQGITSVLLRLELDSYTLEKVYKSFYLLLKNHLIPINDMPYFISMSLFPIIQKISAKDPKRALIISSLLLKDKSIPYQSSLDYFLGILNKIANELKESDANIVFKEFLSVLDEKVIQNKKIFDFCFYILNPIAEKLDTNELKYAFNEYLSILKLNPMSRHYCDYFCESVIKPVAEKLGNEYLDFLKALHSLFKEKNYSPDENKIKFYQAISFINYFTLEKAA